MLHVDVQLQLVHSW